MTGLFSSVQPTSAMRPTCRSRIQSANCRRFSAAPSPEGVLSQAIQNAAYSRSAA